MEIYTNSLIINNYIAHYGVGHLDNGHSGRWPWGSGKKPFQNHYDFNAYCEDLRKQGVGETEIAKSMFLSTTQYRIQKRDANKLLRNERVAMAYKLRDQGFTNEQIAEKIGVNSGNTVANYFKSSVTVKQTQVENTTKTLMELVDKNKMIDVSAGAEIELGVTSGTLQQALYQCERAGYNKYTYGMDQITNPGKKTNVTVLCSPEIVPNDGKKVPKEVYDYANVHPIKEYHSDDNGLTFTALAEPKSLDSKRIKIVYAEDGGTAKDGVIELRPGVEDISLGKAVYAQVRILVDGTHYLKGMAIYNPDLPEGVDVQFNTNKHKGTPMLGPKDNSVLKPIKSDPTNPFGATIKANVENAQNIEDDIFAGGQRWYTDENGKKQQSVINKIRNESDWDKYVPQIASQFVSKQPEQIIQKQLDLTYTDKLAEFAKIKTCTNNTVKRLQLEEFADGCDTAASDLTLSPIPGQTWQVILPSSGMKDDEIYAPNYQNGTKLALVRYPHAGQFEIPVVTVNNNNAKMKKTYGLMTDAVAISSAAASQLSGADFDGDSVICIPITKEYPIASKKALKGLADFDDKAEFPPTETSVRMKKKDEQKQMGSISNLITDMQIKSAPEEDLIKAVKHSMVVIDAVKHELDYKLSEKVNEIDRLKNTYQARINEDTGRVLKSASTLLSMAGSTVYVDERKNRTKINPDTGEKIYEKTGRTYLVWDKNGNAKLVKAQQESTKMAEVKDAYELSSGSPIENMYAEYCNKLKALANEARKEAVNLNKTVWDKSLSYGRYKDEVASLKEKIAIARSNAPRERQAQRIAHVMTKARTQDGRMDKKEYKKIKDQSLAAARIMVGAHKNRFTLTAKEWEAIEAGAVSDSMIVDISNNCATGALEEWAYPKEANSLKTWQEAKISAMIASGRYTYAEIADACGVSTSTVHNYA